MILQNESNPMSGNGVCVCARQTKTWANAVNENWICCWCRDRSKKEKGSRKCNLFECCVSYRILHFASAHVCCLLWCCVPRGSLSAWLITVIRREVKGTPSAGRNYIETKATGSRLVRHPFCWFAHSTQRHNARSFVVDRGRVSGKSKVWEHNNNNLVNGTLSIDGWAICAS